MVAARPERRRLAHEPPAEKPAPATQTARNNIAIGSPSQAAAPSDQTATRIAEVQKVIQTIMKPIAVHSARLRRAGIGYWLRCR